MCCLSSLLCGIESLDHDVDSSPLARGDGTRLRLFNLSEGRLIRVCLSIYLAQGLPLLPMATDFFFVGGLVVDAFHACLARCQGFRFLSPIDSSAVHLHYASSPAGQILMPPAKVWSVYHSMAVDCLYLLPPVVGVLFFPHGLRLSVMRKKVAHLARSASGGNFSTSRMMSDTPGLPWGQWYLFSSKRWRHCKYEPHVEPSWPWINGAPLTSELQPAVKRHSSDEILPRKTRKSSHCGRVASSLQGW